MKEKYLIDFDNTLVFSKGFEPDYLVDPEPNPEMIDYFRWLQSVDKDVAVFTSRDNWSLVVEWMDKIGIEHAEVICVGNPDSRAKGEWITANMLDDYDRIFLYDDNADYLEKAKEVLEKEDVEFIPYLVTDNRTEDTETLDSQLVEASRQGIIVKAGFDWDQKHLNKAIEILDQELPETEWEKLYPEAGEEYNPEIHQFYSEDDMRDRIAETLSYLDDLGDTITIYRAVNGMTDLGDMEKVAKHNTSWESWSSEENIKNIFGGRGEDSWLLEGEVSSKDVDWDLAINRRLIFPEESEVPVKNPENIKLKKITNLGTGKEEEIPAHLVRAFLLSKSSRQGKLVQAYIESENDKILYRGLETKFNPQHNMHTTDAPNGYSTWTDSKELARQYAGTGGYVYSISIPSSEIKDEYIDNDGERSFVYETGKPAGLNNISGKEYLVYHDHDLFDINKIKEASDSGQLVEASRQGVVVSRIIPGEDIKSKTYYHGMYSKNESDILDIFQNGLKGRKDQGKNMLAPVIDSVYMTDNFSYAEIYAFGGNIIGSDRPMQDANSYPVGVIFEIQGSDLSSIKPDEDTIGELVYKALNGDESLMWIVRSYGHLMTDNQKRRVKDGEYNYWAQVGKKFLKKLPDTAIEKIITQSPNISNQGRTRVSGAWVLDRRHPEILSGNKEPDVNHMKYVASYNEYELAKNEIVSAKPDSKVESASRQGVLVKASSDDEYLQAVEAGDMETAQKMVDQAAKSAGYNIGPVYHGTSKNFTEFDVNQQHRGGVFGRGFYFSNDGEIGELYSEGNSPYNVYLKITKPYIIDESELTHKEMLNKTAVFKRKSTENPVIKKGFDAIQYKENEYVEYVVFYPEQIKSSDPVTYDDSGEAIPLSERFNSSTKDIRASRQGFLVKADEDTTIVVDPVDLQDTLNNYGIQISNFSTANRPLGFVTINVVPQEYSYSQIEDMLQDIRLQKWITDASFDKDRNKLFIEYSTEIKEPESTSITGVLVNAAPADAWHGTPYSFEKFTTDNIGKGEGNQAFGWGLYFTDKKEIAEFYASQVYDQDWLADINQKMQNLSKEMNKYEISYGKYSDPIGYKLREEYIKLMDERSNKPKNLYYVTLWKNKQEKLLDWNKRVDEQDDIIKDLVIDFYKKDDAWFSNGIVDVVEKSKISPLDSTDRVSSVDGETFYKNLSDKLGSPKQASEYLYSKGVDGIQYLADGSSGGNSGDAYNYVVFNDNDVTIEEKIAASRQGVLVIAQDFPSYYDIDDKVRFYPSAKYCEEMAITRELMYGTIASVRFTPAKVFYDILDDYYGVLFKDIDSSLLMYNKEVAARQGQLVERGNS